MNPGPDYLGDGVYASFDGYHILLHIGDHRNEAVVALEPHILVALNRYAERTKNKPTDEIKS